LGNTGLLSSAIARMQTVYVHMNKSMLLLLVCWWTYCKLLLSM